MRRWGHEAGIQGVGQGRVRRRGAGQGAGWAPGGGPVLAFQALKSRGSMQLSAGAGLLLHHACRNRQAPPLEGRSIPWSPPLGRLPAHREVDGGLVGAGGQVATQEDGVAHLHQEGKGERGRKHGRKSRVGARVQLKVGPFSHTSCCAGSNHQHAGRLCCLPRRVPPDGPAAFGRGTHLAHGGELGVGDGQHLVGAGSAGVGGDGHLCAEVSCGGVGWGKGGRGEASEDRLRDGRPAMLQWQNGQLAPVCALRQRRVQHGRAQRHVRMEGGRQGLLAAAHHTRCGSRHPAPARAAWPILPPSAPWSRAAAQRCRASRSRPHRTSA